MGKKICYVLLVVFLMLFAAAPAMASQPKQTYEFGSVNYPDPANLGTSFKTGDILHIRDQGGLGMSTGSPWGDFSSVATKNFELNTVSYTGNGVVHYVNTSPNAMVEGTQNVKFVGPTTSIATLFVYHGPPFTATAAGGVLVPITEGKMFTGLLMSGMATAHGIADGKGVQIRVEFTGVSLSGPLTYGLAGNSIICGTVTYWYTGN
jgi:hypothetical protein